MENLPNRLKAARVSANITQEQAAKIVGVSINTIGNIEKKSYRDISIGSVLDYSKLTGESMEYLLYGYDRHEYLKARFEEAKDVIERTLRGSLESINEF